MHNRQIDSKSRSGVGKISQRLGAISAFSIGLVLATCLFFNQLPRSASAFSDSIACGDTAAFIQAMTNARAGDNHTIFLNANNILGCTYTFTQPTYIDPSYGSNALAGVRRVVTIEGNGSTLVRESATDFRFFLVETGGGNLTLHNLTLQNGAEKWGGAIYVRSKLSLVNSAVISNTAAERGGGLYFERINRRYISRTLIMGNLVSSPLFTTTMGGGIYSESEPLGVYHSTVVNNRALSRGGGESRGGGIYNDGNLDVINTTISGNEAGVAAGEVGRAYGGGVLLYKVNDTGSSNVWFYNSIATNNTAFGNDGPNAGRGGGIAHNEDNFYLRNSLVAGNQADTARDVWGDFISYGYNLIGELDGSQAVLDETVVSGVHGNVWGTPGSALDARLGPLMDNGGATWTHALLPGSPAIDAANPVIPTISSVDPPGILPCELYDQRDQPRPPISGNRCDIGPFELDPTPIILLAKSSTKTNLVGDTVSLSVTASSPLNRPITFSAAGLPSGSNIDADTGLISGTINSAGSNTVTIIVSDDQGNSNSTTFTWVITDPPPSCGGPILEAETAILNGNFIVQTDSSASGGQYIEVPNKSVKNTSFNTVHTASYCFGVTQPGTYRIEGMTWSPNGGSNSFYVTINNVPSNGYVWATPKSNAFVSDYIGNRRGNDPIEAFFNIGDHIITIHHREDGTKLDLLRLELVDTHGTNQPPTLTNPGAQIEVVNDSVDFSLTATDPENDSLSFNATDLPTGLTLNTSTGQINGTVSTPGIFNTTFTVADAQGNSDATTVVWFVDASPTDVCGPLTQEAEMARLSGNMSITSDTSASGGHYIEAPKGTIGDMAFGSVHLAAFCFEVIQAGTYRLNASVWSPNSGSNSFYVTVDGTPINGYLWATPTSTEFVADYVSQQGSTNPLRLSLTTGQHIIIVYAREDGTKLDTLMLEPIP